MNPLSNDALNFLSLFTKGELDSLDFEDPFTKNQTRGCRELIEKGIIVEVNMGLYQKVAEIGRTFWNGCPCCHTEPCSPQCTCVNGGSSAGCSRCATYGSPEQQKHAAERLARLTKEVEELRKDKEILDWLEKWAKASLTGVTLDWVKHVENGRVVESGYRVLARFFQSERKPDIRRAIKFAMQQKGQV